MPVDTAPGTVTASGTVTAPVPVTVPVPVLISGAEAIRAGTGLRLSGRKYYCTGALTARWIGVSALHDADRLVLAFVERDAPGVRLDQDWNVMGQRATVSGAAAFDDVAVDPGLVIPYQQAFERPQQLGVRTQLVHAATEMAAAVASDLFSLSGASAPTTGMT